MNANNGSGTIDLNCDMGESFGAYTLGRDDEVMPFITSANIACGWHAGDPSVMDRTVRLAQAFGVGIGAHMGYPDLMGFGRREMTLSFEELLDGCVYQIGALEAFCRKNGTRIHHIKPHGSMNNRADADITTASAIAEAVRLTVPDAPVFAKPGSLLAEAALSKGLAVRYELFADRAYHKDGTLVSRREPGSVLKDPAETAARAVLMATEGRVRTVDGGEMTLPCDTLCVHGDTPGAAALIRLIRSGLEKAGVGIARG